MNTGAVMGRSEAVPPSRTHSCSTEGRGGEGGGTKAMRGGGNEMVQNEENDKEQQI